MNTTNIEQTCPLCGKDKHMGKKAKPLYGHLICRKCYNDFATRRQFAFAVDIILWSVCLGIVLGLAGLSVDAIQGLTFLLFPIFCMKDGFSGSSLGKAMVGVQVIDKTSGQHSGFGASFKRNLPLIIPFMPLIVAFQLHKGNRIGDGWANTRVIWKKYRNSIPFTIGMAGTLVIQKKNVQSNKSKFKTREDYENWKSERLKKLSEKTSHVKAKPEVTIPMAIAEHEKRAITGKRALWFGGIATLIVASLITFQLFLRYQEAEVGFFDIKCDRVSGMVYIKHINAKEWRETKFKSLRHAKAVLSRRQIENAVEDIGDKVRHIEDKVDELQDELQR